MILWKDAAFINLFSQVYNHYDTMLQRSVDETLGNQSLSFVFTCKDHPELHSGGPIVQARKKVELMAQVTFRRLRIPACESKVLTAKRMLLLMQFHILRVVTVSLLHCDVPSSHDLPTQSLMKTIRGKLRCFSLEPNSLIQQLLSET